MALVVMARKAYGEGRTVNYPILVVKPKLGGFSTVGALHPRTRLRLTAERTRFPLSNFHIKNRGLIMMHSRLAVVGSLILAIASLAVAQEATKHVLSSDEVKKAVPAEFFFRGQKAPVQLRNAVGFQLANGKMALAALVDASGYSTAIQQKYQGLLITETKLSIGGTDLAPGQYGFGFTGDGKFVVMSVANDDVLSVAYASSPQMQHAVPLKLETDGSGYKLYAGKKWVGIKAD